MRRIGSIVGISFICTFSHAAPNSSTRIECQMATEKKSFGPLISKKLENRDIQFQYLITKKNNFIEFVDTENNKKVQESICDFRMLYSPQLLRPRLSIFLESMKPLKQSVNSATYLPSTAGHDVQIELKNEKGVCLDDNSQLLIVRCRITSDSAPAPSGLEHRCSKELAVEKARSVGDQIVTVNRIKTDATLTVAKVTETGSHYVVPLVYDTGISVPTYTIKVEKSHCNVSDVTYSNREG